MHHPTDRITHTTAFVTPVVEHWLEREIAQWVHPMKDRSDDPSHHEQSTIRMQRTYTSVVVVVGFFKFKILIFLSNYKYLLIIYVIVTCRKYIYTFFLLISKMPNIYNILIV